MTNLNIMILDDHELILRGMLDLLKDNQTCEVVGTYTASQKLIADLRTQKVDVIVLDYMLSPEDIDGLSLIKLLTTRHPDVALLVVSAHYNSAIVAQALRAGAKGFIGKNLNPATIHKAIVTVAKGSTFLDIDMQEELTIRQNEASNRLNDSRTNTMSINMLSPKELEVIRCFIEGMTVSEIAEKFSRSLKTISGQKQSALRKLGLKSDHELFLIRHEIL
ncbi:response regulator [Vibrio sp. CJQ_6]|uniref:response regulator n=1 Tax=Vibrio sp. CJQ_6 TaxID=3367165 RepID=UPI003709CD8C